MENNLLAIILSVSSAIVSIIGALVVIYKAKPERDKLKSEKKKIDSDGLSSIADAAERIAKGAEISNTQLLKRIEEMEVREVKREEELSKIKSELESVTAQLVEWKDYAFRLGHQLKAHGLEPVPFKSPVPKLQ